MDKVQDYKKKRQDWIDKDVNGGVELPEFMQKRSEDLKKQKDIEKIYTAPKGTKAMAQEKQKKCRLKPEVRRIRNGVITGVALLALFGGPVTKYNSYADITPDGEIATIEQMKNNPEMLEKIATETSNIERWENYKKALENEEITNNELITLSEDIYSLGLDIFKEKASVATDIDKGNIKTSLSSSAGETIIQIKEDESPKYSYQKGDLMDVAIQGWASYIGLDDKAMSEDIADYIKSISDIQTIKNNINTSDINRDKLKKEYNNALDEIEDMLSKKFVLDGNVLKTKAIKKSELSHSIKAEEKTADDEMEL